MRKTQGEISFCICHDVLNESGGKIFAREGNIEEEEENLCLNPESV